jgi:hypothetical protein
VKFRRARRFWFVLAAGGAVVAIGSRLHRGWGATAEERAASLPGDEFIATPIYRSTRAITIDAPPESIWPWLVQMGMGRGGWYSYDKWVALVSSDSAESAQTIIPELQDLQLGDPVDLIKQMVFSVRQLDVNHALVLHADEHQVPMQPWVKTWAFVLRPQGDGSTRLVVRESSAWSMKYVGVLTAVTNWFWFFAARRQLINLKRLAESAATS